jgi:hypothetical protein
MYRDNDNLKKFFKKNVTTEMWLLSKFLTNSNPHPNRGVVSLGLELIDSIPGICQLT